MVEWLNAWACNLTVAGSNPSQALGHFDGVGGREKDEILSKKFQFGNYPRPALHAVSTRDYFMTECEGGPKCQETHG